MKANIYVTLKREVLDPQGDAVRRALDDLGFKAIASVRVGKLIEVEVADGANETPDAARRDLERMCDRLLANPVIEDYRVEILD